MMGVAFLITVLGVTAYLMNQARRPTSAKPTRGDQRQLLAGRGRSPAVTCQRRYLPELLRALGRISTGALSVDTPFSLKLSMATQ